MQKTLNGGRIALEINLQTLISKILNNSTMHKKRMEIYC
jgi:hypothetical protein